MTTAITTSDRRTDGQAGRQKDRRTSHSKTVIEYTSEKCEMAAAAETPAIGQNLSKDCVLNDKTNVTT